MGVYTVGMPVVVSVVAVRAGACDQVDTAAQVHDFRLIPDFAQQGGFEVSPAGCSGVQAASSRAASKYADNLRMVDNQ